jgi:hypothetical protein
VRLNKLHFLLLSGGNHAQIPRTGGKIERSLFVAFSASLLFSLAGANLAANWECTLGLIVTPVVTLKLADVAPGFIFARVEQHVEQNSLTESTIFCE